MFLTTDFTLSNLGRDLPIKIGNNHIQRVQTRTQTHLSLLMYDTVNRNVPSYLSDPFSLHVRTTLTSLS